MREAERQILKNQLILMELSNGRTSLFTNLKEERDNTIKLLTKDAFSKFNGVKKE